MSRLDELINELCPDGVEYCEIGEFCEVITGGEAPSNSVKGRDPSGKYIYPIFSNGVGENSIWGYAETYTVERKAITFSSIGTIGHPVIRQPFFTPIIRLKVIIPDESIMLLGFLKYCLEITEFKKQKSSVPNVNAQMIKKLIVPVPPLEVQHEIVRILDNFTLLTAELTEELTARRKQYEFYSKKIIENHTDGVEMVRLSDLGKWQGGKTPSMNNAEYWENGDVPWISSKDMKSPVLEGTQDHITRIAVTQAPMKLLPEGSIAMVTRSGILKHTFPIAYVPFETTVNQDIKALTVKDGVSARYISLVLQAYSEDIRLKTKKQGGTVDSLDFNQVLNYEVPLPEYEAQKEIEKRLERFDAFCNDITAGLPAEIEARQKQYEYYRDKLLTFKEKEA